MAVDIPAYGPRPKLSDSHVRDREDEVSSSVDEMSKISADVEAAKKAVEGVILRLERLERSKFRTPFGRSAGFQTAFGTKALRMVLVSAASALKRASQASGRVRSASSTLMSSASDPDVLS